MFKLLIYHILLTICIVVAVTSASFIAKTPQNSFNQPFHPTTKLSGSYAQSINGPGHVANIELNTNISSINPDSFEYVQNIQCGQDGIITLTLSNEAALHDILNWPSKVIILISDKWKCSGQSTTQFYLIGNQSIDKIKKQVNFTSEPCEVLKWIESYSFDLAWDQSIKPIKKQNKNLYLRDLDQQTKIDLDILFDSKTGSSSKPNFKFSIGQANISESLVCKNCFTKGSATIGLHVSGTLFNITNATISISGNLSINVDVSVSASVTIQKFSTPDIQIVEIPLTALNVPGLFNLGPALILVANAKVASSLTGILNTGGEISFNNFQFQASLIDKKTNVTGFDKPQIKSHKLSTDIKASVGISGTLKPQLALDLSVLNGLVQFKTGIQIESTLGITASIGNGTGCKKNNQLNLKSTLDGDLGFFVQSFKKPIFTFPSLDLGSLCL
ncbi:putative apple protein [Gigaspora margarita]|uniref:Putative apple protein n=1 Tax=Gigaspora margarita TaxID=4874 RepID=A0A8H4AU57_GIGMA|nr:putative apple protein [Gigaspora margarita]